MRYISIILLFISSFAYSQCPCGCNPQTVVVDIEMGQSNAQALACSDCSSMPSFSNVQIMNLSLGHTAPQPMVCGTNTGGIASGSAAPQTLSIGVVNAAKNDNRYLLKLAVGSSLMFDISGTTAGSWNVNAGEHYDDIVNGFNSLKQQLLADPCINNVVVGNIVFWQGETDSAVQAWADAYASNLSDFADGINALVGGTPNWHIVKIKDLSCHGGFPFWNTVATAQQNYVDANSWANIYTTDTCPTIADCIHVTCPCVYSIGNTF